MARVFRGEGLHKVDGKGRVSIPAPFRRVLEAADPDWTEGLNPNLVIVYGDDSRQYLQCFTMEAIDEVDRKIARMQRGSVEREMLETMFNGQSLPASVDETGRLVLPSKQRQKIGLGSNAYFIAKGDTFQIWNPDTYDAVEKARADAWRENRPDSFDPLTLLPGDEVR